MATSDKLTLRNARLSFAKLFEARSFEKGQDARFEASFLLDPSDKAHKKTIKEIEKTAEALVAEKWKKRPAKLEFGFGYADDHGLEYEGYEGMYFIRTAKRASDGRPLVVDRNNSPVTEEDGVVYSGCYVNATISLWVQDNQYGKRVNANLRGVQFVADGEAFTGGERVDPDDEFDAIDDADEDGYLD